MYVEHFGHPVSTTINTASLFQCPWAVIGGPSCNQGVVVNGTPSGHPDDVWSLCRDARVGVTSPWGHAWRLVLNHANDQVGYIDSGFLVNRIGVIDTTDCRGVGYGVYTTINHASLFQCPWAVIGGPSCNQGEVVNGFFSGHPDDVAAICRLSANSPWGHPWWLVLNHANLQVGFIDSGFLTSQAGGFSPEFC
jgi:hypothetical protein